MTAPRILIAEDEKHIRLALSLLLRQEGYEVEVAADGDEALRRLARHNAPPCHLLITDLEMPELDGLQLIDRLKEERIAIPVIVITGYGNREVALRVGRRRCAAYLDKPFRPDDLIRQVAGALRRPVPVPLPA